MGIPSFQTESPLNVRQQLSEDAAVLTKWAEAIVKLY